MLEFLRDPLLKRGYDQGAERIDLHRRILSAKPMIRQVFEEFYRRMREADDRWFGSTPGLRIELGSGSSLIKAQYPDIITSDVAFDPKLDRVLDAMNLDLPDQSVRALYGVNCFHHFPDPQRFFEEVRRVVRPGGGVVLIDPYFGPLASLLFKNLFREEAFDKGAPGWRAEEQRRPDLPNQALTYVVLFRDRPLFERDNPELSVVEVEVMTNFLRYLTSGGVNFRQLLPTALVPVLRGMERSLRPVHSVFGLHHMVVLKRRDS